MSNLIYFFYELPIPASGLDAPNRVILSGTPVDTPPNPETDPFGFETTFRLDPRSRDLIGKEIVTVPFIDFVEDAIEVPAPDASAQKADGETFESSAYCPPARSRNADCTAAPVRLLNN